MHGLGNTKSTVTAGLSIPLEGLRRKNESGRIRTSSSTVRRGFNTAPADDGPRLAGGGLGHAVHCT
jgi:hypothetical protein